jgi:Cft2 family RNA processing exonuclease
VTHLACYAYGAGQPGEGVCLRIEIDKHRILLDCGPPAQSSDAGAIADDWDLLICSHAHATHGAGLLALHQQFPDRPIYASAITAQLLPLNWPHQVVPTTLCQPLPWRQLIAIADRLTVELLPAGHLPGAATVILTYQPIESDDQRPVRVVYTGDFCLSNQRLADGLRLSELRGLMPDVLILSGAAGTRRQPHRRQQENRLMERLAQALSVGESILLPLPTIGLGQELLYLLRSHYLFSGRSLTIWVDGAVAAGCDAYLDLIDQFPIAVQNFAQSQALFWDDKVQPQVRRGRPATDDNTSPCIVLTDGQTDLGQFCHQGEWLVLLPETLTISDRRVSDRPITPPPNANPVRITAETYALAEHSDGNATCQLIHNLRPQHVIFVHGTIDQLTELVQLDELNSRYKLHLPQSGSGIILPIGEAAMTDRRSQTIGKPIPETRYEGEVVETAAEILISLPPEFSTDPRWRTFADTGIVEAYWQDDRLLLRGMNPAEIAPPRRPSNAMTSGRSETIARSCFDCAAYQAQRCTQPASPLFQLQVTPDGNCLAFQPAAAT